MSVAKKDIDPVSELVEEDDEQSLPEVETAIDLAAAAGPLAAGRAAILRHVKHAPSAPGVYRMVDAHGAVLYVGKAKNIRKRVTSYARPTGYDPRIERMIAATATLEFVSTRTETEALLLEANLIKRLRPRFNVLLRDDKSFPYILITGDHWAPQILKHRGARNRDGRYYGPFASVGSVNRTITALQRAFLLRSCSDGFFESRTRPCLLHQIKRCSAPCTREIEFAEYAELVREATAFLSGKSRAVKEELAVEMEKASETLDFERAAVYRDRLAALSAVQAQQGINPRSTEEADVFAVHQEGGFFCVEVFFFRTGQNWGNRAYFPKADRSFDSGEVLGAFLAQFYDDKPVPELILLSHDIEDRALLEQALSAKNGRKVEIAQPRRGEKKELVDHALSNAREALGRKLADTASQRRLLDGLAECFGLARPPRRIEVYDNSHIQGSNAVGAMVVAGPEGFQKNQYRKFNIRSAELTPGDDFAMMREVLERRFKRLMTESPRVPADLAAAAVAGADGTVGTASVPRTPSPSPLEGEGGEDRRSEPGEGPSSEELASLANPSSALPALGHLLPTQVGLARLAQENAKPGQAQVSGEKVTEQAVTEDDTESEERPDSPWPDLVIIDGGRGQLSAAQAALAALGLTDVPLVAIAKGPERDAGRETFFVPGRDPFKLKPRDPVLYFVQRLRDEAHRFAIGSHRARRKKDIRESGLQEIAGVGPARKRALLQHFGTLKAIERASPADLAKVEGVSDEMAKKIYDFFHERAG
ncbi:MAG TPA: excinuclease ABC subunit UvrC [Xanthobacteraceae bacterium]|nr:excinuclease ABC subunit UvrC [Xanthobacteraceae bacterium]